MGAVAVLAMEPEMPPCKDAISRRRKRAGQRGRDAGARRAHNKMCKANPSRARPDARGGARERATATATRAFGHRRASQDPNRRGRGPGYASRRGTHDGEVRDERLRGELLLRGSHELRGHLLGVGGRGRRDTDGLLDLSLIHI